MLQDILLEECVIPRIRRKMETDSILIQENATSGKKL